MWVEERAIDPTPTTTKELAGLARLLSAMAVIRKEPTRRHDLLCRLAVQYLQLWRGRSPTQGQMASGDVAEAFRDLALDLVYRDVRDLAVTRISNIFALGFVHDVAFVERYLRETRDCILPHAENVNADMFRELSDLVANRARMVRLMEPETASSGATR